MTPSRATTPTTVSHGWRVTSPTYQAPCPSCGATVVFQLGATLLKICEHCGVAVARKGVNLAAYMTSGKDRVLVSIFDKKPKKDEHDQRPDREDF